MHMHVHTTLHMHMHMHRHIHMHIHMHIHKHIHTWIPVFAKLSAPSESVRCDSQTPFPKKSALQKVNMGVDRRVR